MMEFPQNPDVKKKDLELYHKWKLSQSKVDLSNLLHSLNPLIQKEVSRASGSLPKAALEAEAKKWAVEAIKKFDPNAGVLLSTFVTSYLQKVRRLNYDNQNMVRIPESRQLEYGEFTKKVEYLRDSLNREPHDHEIAAEMGWKPFEVKKFKGMLFEDHYESGNEKPVEAAKYDFERTKFDYIMEQLDEQEKIIMHNLMHEDGKRMNATQLADKLGVNQNRLSYLKTKLKKKIKGFQQELGEWE